MRHLLLLLLVALACTTTALPTQAQSTRRTVTWGSSVSLHDATLTTVGVVDVECHDDVDRGGEVHSGTISFTVVSPCWRVRLGTETYGIGWQQGYCLYFPVAGAP